MKKKPTDPGRLFYKDMFKLKPNTELTYHYETAFGAKVEVHYQFIKVGVKKFSDYYNWALYYRAVDGGEYSFWFSAFGIVPHARSKGWSPSYLTLRHPNT